MIKRIKLKSCASCKTFFAPKSTLAKVCSTACAINFVREKKEAEFKFETRKMKAALNENDLSFQRAKAQKAFNEFIRLRDAHLGCISCDKPAAWGGQWHASHWKSRGARPDLAFNEDNVHKACSICNNWLSGNVINFKESLVLKIGSDRVERLEKDIDSFRHSASDYAKIHKTYTMKIKELKELACIKI